MTDIDNLISGYKNFYHQYFQSDTQLYKELSSIGQSPKTLIIACSDSRVDPSILTEAAPGDIFVIRNVANIVPPFENASTGLHGVSAAVEFAVRILGVEHIVVLGHSQCAGIRALIDDTPIQHTDFISSWVQVAKPARDSALAKSAGQDTSVLQCTCERESIVNSLGNLMTFPWISDKIQSQALSLHGWYFPVETGQMQAYDFSDQAFKPVL